jgi:hypothetical protein
MRGIKNVMAVEKCRNGDMFADTPYMSADIPDVETCLHMHHN